ncbi:MAG TPA: hypothetical protein PLR02_06705 [Rhodocyclaceae bacterium]|nr:hypothetical protein [Rhodocyclaceae bacterium]
MIDPQRYDQARDRIAKQGFTSEIQTKIALLLTTAKNGNLMFHSGVQWMHNLSVVQQFILSQYSRELEAVTLLSRTTQWSHDPGLVAEGSRIVAPLVMAWGQIMMPPGPMLNPQAAYRGISLGHAQLARIRVTPVIPENADPLAPFVVALQRIEQENGRMLQTQIRLLKNMGSEVPIEAREALVEADQKLVDGVFNDFLQWLAAP